MSHLLDIPPARPGEKILPAYNTLAKAVREWRWFQGEGIRILDTPLGATIIREPDSLAFNHPWRVSGGAGICTVSPGFVEGVLPWIDGRPIDGLAANGAPDPRGVPTLKLADLFDDNGYSWIALRLLCDKDLKLLASEKKGAEILQTNVRTWGGGYSLAVKSGDGWQGDYPIALLRRTGKTGFGSLFQLAHFNIRCRPRTGKFWFFV